MRILGISAYYHDSAAALLVDGRIVAAAQEERFTRKRHDARFPALAMKWCLEDARIRLSSVDHVVFYDKPFLKFERLLETYLAFAPRGLRSFLQAIPIWLQEKLFLRRMLCEELRRIDPDFAAERLLFSEHHLSHAASAFFPSPFDESLILTLDGVGEWATTSAALGRGNHIDILKEIHFPHSIGLLYSAFTYYLGFKVNSGEYKVMGLAPYGSPRHVDTILSHLMDVREDGSFRMNQRYFDYCTGLTMTAEPFHELFGGPPRAHDSPLTQHHMDLAASVQAVTELVTVRLTRALAKETSARNLCLAGGVALNCVANGKVLADGRFDSIWVQPAAGDAGGAVGAALAAYHLEFDQPRSIQTPDGMSGSYLGPSYTDAEIAERLAACGASFTALSDTARDEATVDALTDGKAVGWFQGRMEYGPRALGARSIIADARNTTMQRTLNLKVKYRESFRPFAPSVLMEDAAGWFEPGTTSPYMLMVCEVAKQHRLSPSPGASDAEGIERLNQVRSTIPAVTHVDYSARLQTVDRRTNPRFHSLLTAFKARTGCPVLVNTSFNVRGEPIVRTPEDAFRCFMGTEIDLLVIGGIVLHKHEQNPELKQHYAATIEPD